MLHILRELRLLLNKLYNEEVKPFYTCYTEIDVKYKRTLKKDKEKNNQSLSLTKKSSNHKGRQHERKRRAKELQIENN